jgi:hypothetical protein
MGMARITGKQLPLVGQAEWGFADDGAADRQPELPTAAAQ